MNPPFLPLTKIISRCSIFCAMVILLQSSLFSQGDTIASFWQGNYTPNIIDPHITVSNLTEGPGIAYHDCPGNYVFASGFDQSCAPDGLANGDYWEFSITPDPGYLLTVNYYEVQRRASLNTPGEVNTLGTLYWKIGSGSWVQSDITAQVQPIIDNFCTTSSSRRPHQNTNFSTSETVTFRIVRYIYDNEVWGFSRITRNGYQWVSGNVSIIVPVELSKFEVQKERQMVALNWETTTETNNAGFEIERSTDGRSWQNIGFVEGNGTTKETQQYMFTDTHPTHGDNYYRLKQIDFDGKNEYSPSRHILFTEKPNEILNIFPNPVVDDFSVSVFNPNRQWAEVKLFSSTGQLIYKQVFKEGEMNAVWKRDFSLPQEEMYFVTIRVGNVIETKKVVVIDKR